MAYPQLFIFSFTAPNVVHQQDKVPFTFFNVTILVFCMLTFFMAEPSFAQDKQRWSFNFFLENDLFANTDLNYTNGVRFSSISPDLKGFEDPDGLRYPWIEKLNDFFKPIHPDPKPGSNNLINQNIVLSLGQLMFTPADRTRKTIDPNDRPYAGWLYFGVGYHAKTQLTLHSTEINIGVVGPSSLAQQSQDLVHNIGNISLFEGWDNQLRNEFAFQLSFERKRKFAPLQHQFTHGLEFDAISHWGASLGNVATYLNAGAELRLGWNLPDDFGASTLRPGGDNNTPGLNNIDQRPWQFHSFVTFDARIVVHNIFLDGNTFKESHSVSKEHLIGNAAIGLTLARKRFRLTYAQVFNSKEFKRQVEAQAYGSISVSYSHPF